MSSAREIGGSRHSGGSFAGCHDAQCCRARVRKILYRFEGSRAVLALMIPINHHLGGWQIRGRADPGCGVARMQLVLTSICAFAHSAFLKQNARGRPLCGEHLFRILR